MGKKSKKKTGGGGAWTKTTGSGTAAPGGAEFIAEVDNPDGSKAMMLGGERTFIGGRTQYIGNAAMPLGFEPYSYDPIVQRRYAAFGSTVGERQIVSMKALHSAFRRKFGEGDNNMSVDPMTETCLSLEAKIGIYGYDNKLFGRAKFTKEEINESLVMSTHRWIITILPMCIIKEVGDMAQVYRKALERYEPLLAMNESQDFPTPAFVFGALRCVTEENRAEVICLLNELLMLPFGINVYIFSEVDNDIHLFMKEFVRSEHGLLNLPKDTSSSEILKYIHNQSGWMDTSCCFWCEKTKLTTERLFLCTGCMSVSYCSKECQKNDWKAFHKPECRQLSEKTEGRSKTRDDLGMDISRSKTLRMPGKAFNRIPLPIATEDDESNIFRGDIVAGYVTSSDPTLTEKTKLFPLGLQVLPREMMTAGDAS